MTSLLIGANGLPMEKIMKYFGVTTAQEIFSPSPTLGYSGVTKCKFDGVGKRKVLDAMFGPSAKIGDCNNKLLVATTFDLKDQNPFIFTNVDKTKCNYLLRDIADASSAAPTLFPAVSQTKMNKKN